MVKIPKLQFRNQMLLINTLSKVFIFVALVLVLPGIVSKTSRNNTDTQLLNKIDDVYFMIDSLGIDEFIDSENAEEAFGSYNIFKEEYLSIEPASDTVLYERFENSLRVIEDEVQEFRVLTATIHFENNFYLIEIGKSLSEITRIEEYLQRFIFIFLFIVLAVSTLSDVAFTQLLLRPFNRIVAKLKSTNNPITFDFEKIETVTADFEYLQESLHHLMQRTQVLFNNEREYIGNVSHELLTPISILQSKFDNMLQNTEISDQFAEQIIETKLTLGRLTGVVKSLLLLSRLENEEFLLNESVDLNEIITATAEQLTDRAEMKNIVLSVENSLPTLQIRGNAILLQTLLFNLITNALKFTPNGGSIEIRLFHKNNANFLSVTDSGSGIPPEQIPHIFERFRKFDPKKSGYGLGLAIVKKIADYHKVEIIVQSEVNKGTTFTLKI